MSGEIKNMVENNFKGILKCMWIMNGILID